MQYVSNATRCSTASSSWSRSTTWWARTQFTYDLTNRLYAKKDIAREVLSLSLSQTYYTDRTRLNTTAHYQSSFTVQPDRTPTSRRWRCRSARPPTDRLQADFRTEWDPDAHALKTISANGTFSRGDWLNGSAGWSQRRFIPDLPGSTIRTAPTVHQQHRQLPALPQPDRRQLLVQLRLPARPLPQPALGGVLQCAVLRRGIRVPDLQPAGLAGAHRRCRRTADSTSRSRWPESARSPICSARSAGSRAADRLQGSGGQARTAGCSLPLPSLREATAVRR